MFTKKQKIYHPELYHGSKKDKQFFEGWYFKLISKDMSKLLAIIPGVIKGSENYAFIQVLVGKNGRTFFNNYPLSSFKFDPNEFDVSIENNHFSLNSIHLDIKNDNLELKGEVAFIGIQGWPQTFLLPGAMGWFARIPFMQCYHGVLGFDHELSGQLEINGDTYNFENGRGYIEKDWGSAFPESYIWMQSNHFQEPEISFMASVATIPWLGTTFGGFIIGLHLKGELYEFATYNLSKITKLEHKEDFLEFSVKKGKYTLNVSAEHHQSGEIKGPTSAGMDMRVMESLTSVIKVEMLLNNELIFTGIGQNAGMEVQGDIDFLKKHLGLRKKQ